MNIKSLTLIGMSGVGKSFWAERLREEGFTWLDCDRAIADSLTELLSLNADEAPVHAVGRWMGMPWRDGYPTRQARYLALEAKATRNMLNAAVSQEASSVVDTTGSVVYLPDALLGELRQKTHVLYLAVPEGRHQQLLERYLDEPKPVLWGDTYRPLGSEEAHETLRRCYPDLLSDRDRRYRALAHQTLDPAEVADVQGLLDAISCNHEA